MIMAQSGRRAVNLTLDQSLLSDARALGISLSRAAEAGLRQAVHEARAERWRQENAAALAASNAWVDEKGPPLGCLSSFLDGAV
ncbi:type II toxin-antitoxin system CcdA family antitoxin [Paracoccus sp. DMF-8]|uniref:type II toxin-antitoxin system CcdA family antitoxin n=1 Tax=Paracoccus sp. DMF-8 TaxID=3019445 RepID=UPI0023E430AF|nr:type II toxin-antitoxin system CcdA family antitoxin [Paracoccus sp. DMF-8]MDF3607635.1 type II toxin-antitoxin system CcdA family antitoxin [Paracoccus sp. DMF-8]